MNIENIMIPKQEVSPSEVKKPTEINLDDIIDEVNRKHTSSEKLNGPRPPRNEPADMSNNTTRRLDARGNL